jgi:hypothetical protein
LSLEFLVAGSACAQQATAPAGQAPGQAAPGQASPQGKSAPGQATSQGKAAPGQAGAFPGSISPQPFFQNPLVQKHLNVNPDQVRRMNEAFGQVSGQFQNRFGQLSTLTPQQRAERLRTLSQDFNNQLSRSFGQILNEQQMQRFNQLNLQQQGFSVFQDPRTRSQLNLTDAQVQQLQKASQDFDQQLLEISRLAQTNSQQAAKRYNDLSQQRMQNINTILNQQQRQAFQNMIGDPFNFPPNFGATTAPQR